MDSRYQVHYGEAELVDAKRQKTLDHAFRAYPSRQQPLPAERGLRRGVRLSCGQPLIALAAVEAVTGHQPGVRVLPCLVASADSAGFPRIAPAYARAGDIVLAGDPPRLGVVVEAGRAAFVGPHGLTTAAITECSIAWRIG